MEQRTVFLLMSLENQRTLRLTTQEPTEVCGVSLRIH
ncbi:hypothetical protein LINPERPRIM_LOCUS3169 [Linum perenne]